MAETTDNTISIALTPEGVMGLKQACDTIINAYNKNIMAKAQDDENAILPSVTGLLKEAKTNITAGKNAVTRLSKVSIEDYEDSELDEEDGDSYTEIGKNSSNYAVTKADKAGVRAEVSKIISSGGGTYDPKTAKSSKKSSGSATVLSYKSDKLSSCIPCEFRWTGDSFSLSPEFTSMWQNYLSKIREHLNSIKNLLKNTEVVGDICSLFDFLNVHCLPDLNGILALLTLLIQKYTSASLDGLRGGIDFLIGPIFSPMLSGVSDLLEKYINIIIGPIECIVRSLDNTLAKLDVGSALKKANNSEIAELNNTRISLIKRRGELSERLTYLNRLLRTEKTPGSEIYYTLEDSPPIIVGSSISQTSLGSKRTIHVPNVISRSIGSEIESVNDRIATVDKQILLVDSKLKDRRGNKLSSTAFSSNKYVAATSTAVTDARQALNGFSDTLYSGLQTLRTAVIEGRRTVRDTLKGVQQELERVLLGSAATSEEKLIFLAEIQKLVRLKGIIDLLFSLDNLDKICKDESAIDNGVSELFDYLKRGSGNAFNYIKDSDGNLIVARSDVELELYDTETGSSSSIMASSDNSGLTSMNNSITDSLSEGKILKASSSLGASEYGSGDSGITVVPLNICSTGAKVNFDFDKVKEWANTIKA